MLGNSRNQTLGPKVLQNKHRSIDLDNIQYLSCTNLDLNYRNLVSLSMFPYLIKVYLKSIS